MRPARRWALPWRNPHLAPGMRLGKYRIVRRLAVGGMAEIFLARVESIRGFEKLVVVKRLLPQYVANLQLVRMFLDEARLMATLNHPNITQVHDVGEARGSYFFAMEYVHGEDLRTILRAAAHKGQALPVELAVGIIADAAAGLHHAHEKRGSDGTALDIVHRDVSPSNVLVSFDGAVKVTDFGVAKWARQESHTRHGTLKGKCAYMSPEQCRGEPLDRRSDVFALGILLYELTTGTRLFQGASDFAILNQIVDGRIVPPSQRRAGFPPALDRIVMRALERPRDRRFPTARDMQLALEAFAHEQRLPVTPMVRARFVQDLFARKLAAWRAAETAGRSLGQHLASLPETQVLGFEDDTGDGQGTPAEGSRARPVAGTGTQPEGTGMGGVAAAPIPPEVTPVLPSPAARRAWWAVAAVVVAAGATAGALAWQGRQGGAAIETPATAAVTAAPEPSLARAAPAAHPDRAPRPRIGGHAPRAGRAEPTGTRSATARSSGRSVARGHGAASERKPSATPERGREDPRVGARAPAAPETPPAASERERVKVWDSDSVLLPK